MATSGSVTNPSTGAGYPYPNTLTVNWSITETGSNYHKIHWELVATGGQTNYYQAYWNTSVWISFDGGSTLEALIYAKSGTAYNGSVLYSGDYTIYHTDSRTFWIRVGGGYNSSSNYAQDTASWTLDALYSNPATPSVTLLSKTYNSATFSVSLSSYGIPSSASGRYIEAAILGSNSYGSPYRYSTSSNTTSATITVNNSSSGTLSITGNTKYWYGGYASNTARSSSTVRGTFYTPCPPLSALSLSSQSYSSYNTVSATFSYTRQSDGGAETRTGYYRYSTNNGSYTSWISLGTISSTSGTFTISLPTSSSVTLQMKLSTPNGGDSTTKSVSITTKTTHSAPTFSNFAYEDISSTALAVTGNNQIFIQSQSRPKVTISTANKATAKDGASITSYTASLNAQSIQIPYSSSASTSASFSAGTPTAAGTLALSVAANDSIGLSTAVSKNVTVIPWSAPTMNATAVRTHNFEAETTLKISGGFSPVKISNITKNSVTVAYRFKKSSASSWGNWIDRPVTASNGTFSATDLILSFDNQYQWDIEVRVVDIFTTTVQAITLSVGKPIFFVSKNQKVSVNRKPTNSAADLDVAGFIYSKDQPVMTSHVGQIIMSTTLTTANAVREVYGGYWASYSGFSVSGLYCWRRTS